MENLANWLSVFIIIALVLCILCIGKYIPIKNVTTETERENIQCFLKMITRYKEKKDFLEHLLQIFAKESSGYFPQSFKGNDNEALDAIADFLMESRSKTICSKDMFPNFGGNQENITYDQVPLDTDETILISLLRKAIV